MLTHARVSQVLRVDPEAGHLFWIADRSPKVRAGDRAGHFQKQNGYRVIGLDSKVHKEHRIAWMLANSLDAPDFIDHINGNRSDNRPSNLRAATRSENSQNIHKAYKSNKSSGVLGVYWHQCGKWQARIQVNGKAKSLGLFERKEDAHAVYLLAKKKKHTFWRAEP